MQQLLVLGSLCILIGLDLRISQTRWKIFGPEVELNPLVRLFVREKQGAFGFLLCNLPAFLLAILFPPLAFMLLGAKISLCALQLRSLQLNEHSNPRQSPRH